MDKVINSTLPEHIKDMIKMETCELCGFKGYGVSGYPTYDYVLERNITHYECDDHDECLERQYSGYREKLEDGK